MSFTIGAMAKKLGVRASTLRYYDKEGLLPFVERSSGGIRLFKESDFEWLSVIECLKHTGMPIKDIKTFIDWCLEGDSTIGKRLSLITQQREAVIVQMAQLQKTLDILDYKQWYYRIADEAGTRDVPANMLEKDIPVELREIRRKIKGKSK